MSTQHDSDQAGTVGIAQSDPRLRKRRIIARLLRAELLMLLPLAVLAVLAVSAHSNSYFSWDLQLERLVQTHNSPGIDRVMTLVSIPGNGWVPYVITGVTVLALLAFKLKPEALGLLFTATFGPTVNTILKLTVARPRPSGALVSLLPADRHGLSFPSGHVVFYCCYFGFLFFVAYALIERRSPLRYFALTLAALPIVLVALSRIYLGAHWPSDTIAAYLLSGLCLTVGLRFYHNRKLASFEREADGKLES